jgi:hypothetical protein
MARVNHTTVVAGTLIDARVARGKLSRVQRGKCTTMANYALSA